MGEKIGSNVIEHIEISVNTSSQLPPSRVRHSSTDAHPATREAALNATVHAVNRLRETINEAFGIRKIGELLRMKSKYGPGGKFEPDWYVLLSFIF